MASFGFKKIPGAMVSKIQNGYKVGESVLPESQSPITQEVGVVSAVVARIMIATTDDKRFALVA